MRYVNQRVGMSKTAPLSHGSRPFHEACAQPSTLSSNGFLATRVDAFWRSGRIYFRADARSSRMMFSSASMISDGSTLVFLKLNRRSNALVGGLNANT